MIPDEHRDAVRRGLREAFGVTACDEISPVTGGHTPSLVFRVIVGGSPYLMKIITRAEDPTRHYTCMRAAADAGVAPRVWYTSAADKISITDFVKAEALPISEALVRLPALLWTLHAAPPFARAPFNTTCTFLLHKSPALDGFLERFRAPELLSPADLAEFFARYDELAAVYPYDDGEMVSCHNDLFKPDNIMFDGQRAWLVDWEAAFLNDRYADLTVVANQVVANEADELIYLREYFGAAPDEYQRARFHLMQQIVHLFYTMAFLVLGSSGTVIDWTAEVPDFASFQRRWWAGEFDISKTDVKIVYGRIHWAQLRHNVRQPRYTDALRVISDRNAKTHGLWDSAG